MNIGDKVYNSALGKHFKGVVVHKREAGRRLLIKWENGVTREHESGVILKWSKTKRVN
jgi:hypothetical protein|tara:strand:- start:305 stop:478 length:174 start_codon:yes stop_codon:yes gene_type:complete